MLFRNAINTILAAIEALFGVYNVKRYGAKGDSGYDDTTSTSTTGGTTTVTTTNATFVTDGSDVGRTVMIAGAGASNGAYYGTVAGVTDSKHATLSSPVTADVTGRTLVVYRTDDTATFTAAITAASATVGGKVVVPNGVYNASQITISDATRRLWMRLEGNGPASVIVPPQNKIGIYLFAAREAQVANLKIVGGQCGIWIDSNPRGVLDNLILWDQAFGTTSPAPPWDGDGIFIDGDDSTEITLSNVSVNRAMGTGIHYWRGTTQDNGGIYLHNVKAVTSSVVGLHGYYCQGQGGGKGYGISGTGLTGTITPHPRDTAASGMTLTYNTDANGTVTQFTVAGGTGYTRAPYLNFGSSPTIVASLKPYTGSGGSTGQDHPVSGGYGAGTTYTVLTNTSGAFTFATNVVCDGYSDTLSPAAGPAMVIHNAANVRITNFWATGSVAGKGALWLNNVVQNEFANVWAQNGNAADTTASHIRIENTSHDVLFNNVVFPKSCAYGISFDGTNYNVQLGDYVSDLEQRTSPSNGVLTNDFTQLVHQTGTTNRYRYRSAPAFVTSTAENAYGAVAFYDAANGTTPKKYQRINAGNLEWLSDAFASLMTLSDAGALSPLSLTNTKASVGFVLETPSGGNTSTNAIKITDPASASGVRNKYLRINGGILQLVDSAFAVALWTLDNSGNAVTNGTQKAAGYLSAQATKSGAYTLTDTDGQIFADTTSAGFTLTLPAASTRAGRIFQIKRVAGTNNVTVASAGGNVDGASTATISTSTPVRYMSDGTNWWSV